MHPIQHRITVESLQLMVYEWGNSQNPAVLFLHATGFHARCWDAVIRHLDGFHCFAVDMCGHGRSDKPAQPHTWQQFGSDIAAIARQLGLKKVLGVGHSMGGNALTRAAAAVPEAFGALMLIDPVIFPQAWYTLDDYTIDGHFILNRRRQWASADEMYQSFKGRKPFTTWQDAVLRDYCEYGLLPDGDSHQLACPPEVEAHLYSSSRLKINFDIYTAIRQIQVPVRVLRCANIMAASERDLSTSPTAPDLAAHFAHGTDLPLTENTHFIPMETPDLVAEQVRTMITS
jgi:pimeloyl-ACP methyl ester carboxylesterase